MDSWIVVTTARQIDGELVLVKLEKGFTSEQKANELMHQLQKNYMNHEGPKEIFITTEYGSVSCYCVASVMNVMIDLGDK